MADCRIPSCSSLDMRLGTGITISTRDGSWLRSDNVGSSSLECRPPLAYESIKSGRSREHRSKA